jgi:dolichyl-phosphate beta-glucosyltransferase
MMWSSLETTIAALATCIVTVGISWILYPAWVVRIADKLEWTVQDLNFGDGNLSGKDGTNPDPPILTLVIPAYNEQDRIPIMLQEAHDYLTSPKGISMLKNLKDLHDGQGQVKTRQPLRVEWMIVNDGSTDDTCQIVQSTYQSISNTSQKGSHCWKIISLTRNSGKGAAVKTGMNLATGLFHLMVDADGATEFGPGMERLVAELAKGTTHGQQTARSTKMVAAFGSRAHLQQEATAQRSFIRTLLMKAFHFFVSLFVSSKIQDTQCGFKLFSQDASDAVFGTLHLRRWAFDTEVVLLCHFLEIGVLEVGVPWHEVDGSKLSTSKLALAIVSVTMLRDMICVRTCYTIGIWKVKRT